jgi:ubiquinol-cytochrome c reductase cytochrome b subunit
MMATAFLGYVLPMGMMSFWGATVITNLLSAIPWIGMDFVQFVWGGFSVNNATLNRFFSLHYLLPFLLAALAAMHLLTLHEHGSSNPLGSTGNVDRLPFHPWFTFKDLVTIFMFFVALGWILFYAPNLMGHSDNYIPANPMVTPASIVPEWYLLPFYAILRSIPDKLLGVIAMFGSLLVLLTMPILDTSRVRGATFRPLLRAAFWILVADFWVLMILGSQHVEAPFIVLGQLATALYFGWFFVIIPAIGIIENTLADLR